MDNSELDVAEYTGKEMPSSLHFIGLVALKFPVLFPMANRFMKYLLMLRLCVISPLYFFTMEGYYRGRRRRYVYAYLHVSVLFLSLLKIEIMTGKEEKQKAEASFFFFLHRMCLSCSNYSGIAATANTGWIVTRFDLE